jgi:hypothetical protein
MKDLGITTTIITLGGKKITIMVGTLTIKMMNLIKY